MRLTVKQITGLKTVLHLAAFLPFIWLVFALYQGEFSADPAKDIQHFTGRMALKLLLATLLVSPLARQIKQPLLIRTTDSGVIMIISSLNWMAISLS